MNDPLNWVALCIAIVLGLPPAIDGYKQLFKSRKKQPLENENEEMDLTPPQCI